MEKSTLTCVGVFFVGLAAGLMASRIGNTPHSKSVAKYNGLPSKTEGGITYVQSPAWSEPSWKRVVETTSSKIKRFRPDVLTAKTTIEILNDDDTVMFLDNAETAKRIQAELAGKTGWPIR